MMRSKLGRHNKAVKLKGGENEENGLKPSDAHKKNVANKPTLNRYISESRKGKDKNGNKQKQSVNELNTNKQGAFNRYLKKILSWGVAV